MITWKKETRDERVSFTLSGEITEDAPLEALANQINPPHVVLDLAEVRRINSCGVRDWLRMIRSLEAKGVSLVLERCSVPIVHHLNMITGFEGHGSVRSVFAPYYCGTCNIDTRRLLLVESGRSDLSKRDTCPKCGGQMEFDDIPEIYERWFKASDLTSH
jgi:anti-anti-sigma regulatory factor